MELPFEITDSRGIQRFELVDELIMGQLELIKSDARQPDRKLAGARFKFTNLDTNSATILITDEDGKSSQQSGSDWFCGSGWFCQLISFQRAGGEGS